MNPRTLSRDYFPFLFAICINTFSKCCVGMRKYERENKIKEWKLLFSKG
jgi:hypothetical protein